MSEEEEIRVFHTKQMHIQLEKKESYRLIRRKPIRSDIKVHFSTNQRSSESEDSFHEAIGPVLVVAQAFGLMPVCGVLKPSPKTLKFKWDAQRMFLTALNSGGGILVWILYFESIYRVGITAKNMVGTVFFSSVVVSCLLFLDLARKWPSLMRNWSNLEELFLQPPYKVVGRSLTKKIRLTAILWFSLAALEHILAIASNTYNQVFKIKECNWDVNDPVKFFFTRQFTPSLVFKFIPYNIIIGLLMLILNLALTFNWNYMDIFIILVSKGLSTRFDQLNHRLNGFKGQRISQSLWLETRLHYAQLCELVELVDTCFASLVLISCANNLYFICFQLLNIYNKLPHLINYVYFWFSLLYLIGRTITMLLVASNVNEAALKPLRILRAIPTDGWNLEAERFLEQVKAENVALSGKKFFFLTKNLFFAMAATIVTYELVLLQFDQGSKTVEATIDPCS